MREQSMWGSAAGSEAGVGIARGGQGPVVTVTASEGQERQGKMMDELEAAH